VTLEHLVHDLFNSEGITKLEGVPETATDLYFSEKNFTFDNSELNGKAIHFSLSHPIRQEGMKTWFSELNLDKEANLLTGYLNLGISVDQLYNAKVSFE
ncbi:MAG: hypothetical protein ACPG5W_11235, partial [Flavobacteriales bacterium]